MRAFQLRDGVAQRDLLRPGAVLHHDEAEALVLAGLRPVVRRRGGGKPPFVDPAPVPAEGIVVGGVELDPAAGHAERPRHPRRREPKDALALLERLLDGALD